MFNRKLGWNPYIKNFFQDQQEQPQSNGFDFPTRFSWMMQNKRQPIYADPTDFSHSFMGLRDLYSHFQTPTTPTIDTTETNSNNTNVFGNTDMNDFYDYLNSYRYY
jgi:hypothetical protein